MTAAIFVGPTLFADGVLLRSEFTWLPPAAAGDVYRVACKKPRAIGLIDGRFETVPSVWHKEILWALAKGIHVYGAASMGALRAAELDRFGMVGVGSIYDDFRRGILQDDDEVAVVHAPAELRYRPLSEAMVDIRATLAAAKSANVISQRTADALQRIAKDIFFKERNWDVLFAHAANVGLPKLQLARLVRWLPANRVDRKRLDALSMIEAMRLLLGARPRPFRPRFKFQHTVYWQNLIERGG
jgi:hypothetical protein